ncbi:MAG: hypothetical protein K9M82_02000 [Deltaproteobacteria bacterium]|nr:hypothetical protein [Deltaproteobacteria bacterium]
MIITTASGKSYDSQTDLSPEERHILQKLFLWESMASTVEEFRERTDEALQRGWNNSGPVRAGSALNDILRDLETRVARRLNG